MPGLEVLYAPGGAFRSGVITVWAETELAAAMAKTASASVRIGWIWVVIVFEFVEFYRMSLAALTSRQNEPHSQSEQRETASSLLK